jgi:hypothetical protein
MNMGFVMSIFFNGWNLLKDAIFDNYFILTISKIISNKFIKKIEMKKLSQTYSKM